MSPCRPEFDPEEHAPTAHVADERVAFGTCLQARPQPRTLPVDGFDQVVIGDCLLNFQSNCAGEGMIHMRLTVLEHTGSVPDRGMDMRADDIPGNRLVAGRQAFSDRDDIGRDPVKVMRQEPARAAHSRHDVIEDQQNAVPGADVTHGLEVACHGGDRAIRRPDDGLRYECRDGFGAECRNRLFEFVGEPADIGRIGFAIAPAAIGVTRRDEDVSRQQRLEHTTANRIM